MNQIDRILDKVRRRQETRPRRKAHRVQTRRPFKHTLSIQEWLVKTSVSKRINWIEIHGWIGLPESLILQFAWEIEQHRTGNYIRKNGRQWGWRSPRLAPGSPEEKARLEPIITAIYHYTKDRHLHHAE